MSRLDDIREQLYRKPPPDAPARAPEESPLPPAPSHEGVENTWKVKPAGLEQVAPKPRFFVRPPRLRDPLIIGAGIIIIAIGAWIAYTIFFPASAVELSILGPSQVVAGESAVFSVRIQNHSNVALREGSVTLTFPQGTASADDGSISTAPLRMKLEFPDLARGAESRQDIRIRPFGTLGQDLMISGVYLYRPENIQSKLTRSTEAHFSIARIPIALTVDASSEVRSGQEYTLSVSVDSELSQSLSGIALGVELPNGFEVKRAEPAFPDAKVSVWPLEELTSGSSRTFKVIGTIQGDPEEVKSFHVRLGTYEPKTKSWFLLTENTVGPTIASPVLLVQSTLNGARSGSLAPGARIDGNVYFRNNLSQKIENVSILLSFPEKFVELQTIKGEHGFYNVTNQTLTWNPASESRLLELGPGEEGTLAFSFQLKSQLPIRTFSDKNFIFPVKAVIDSSFIPEEYHGVPLRFEDVAQFKIESLLGLSARSTYYDSSLPNTGPLPPKVRRTTSYTLYLRLTSGANDLNDVEVRAQLPGGVVWKGVIAADVGSIAFNPSTQEIVWSVPTLASVSGILRQPASAAFQVELTPSEGEVGTAPTLMQNIRAEGRDTFTATTQSATTQHITTDLETDKRTASSDWRVVP